MGASTDWSGPGEGERRAFDEFIELRLARAYRLAGALLAAESDRESALRDAAVGAWRHWSEDSTASAMDARFDRLVVDACRARLPGGAGRRLALRRRAAAAERSTGMASDTLQSALAALDADDRVVVVLRYMGDLSPAEIATRTGTAERTVRSQLQQAFRDLRLARSADGGASR